MEKFTLEKDIKVMYITADSFPAGITPAHLKLQSTVPFSTERGYFGISRPEPEKNGEIVYKAAAGILSDDEPEKFRLETMTIPAGTYISKVIENYMENIGKIAETFAEILKLPNLDPNGYCIEQYIVKGKDVRCMVKLAS